MVQKSMLAAFFDESEIYAVAAEENHLSSYVLYLKVRREIDDVVGDVALLRIWSNSSYVAAA